MLIAGHDVGGLVAELEAYSYKDVDGLIVVTMADQGFTPWIIQRATEAAWNWCTANPQPASDQPGSPSGYANFVSDQEWRQLLFFDADPRVIDVTVQLKNRNPCGILRSTETAVVVDHPRLAEITVPVLVVFGDNDTLVWTRQGQQQQQDNYGSTDKTTIFIPRAGHFVMFEKTAPQMRAAISAWLRARPAPVAP